MTNLRIRGLVRVAERVRRDLARPTSAEERGQLRRVVANALEQVREILAGHGAVLNDLPAPTRSAYQFLAQLNIDDALSATTAQARPGPTGNVSLIGLPSFWHGILDRLARVATPEAAAPVYDSLRQASMNIERHLEQQALGGSQLTSQTRTIRGWLAFFAERANFDEYIAALNRAKPALETGLRTTARFQSPTLVHFRPTSGLYGLRGYRDATRIVLPTPMITFPADLFGLLASVIFGGARHKQPILEALAGENCQGILAELDALSGVADQAAGVYRDLAASFERIRQEYFDGQLGRPRLAWSRTFTGRKFGHYDRIRDTVMISCTLDQATVPVHALDFVMYHELLHKQLGVDWRNGRAAVHTPEFRAAERRFEGHAQAEEELKRLAASHR
jgi:hypothetical protein